MGLLPLPMVSGARANAPASDRNRAQVWFDQARGIMAQGKYAVACGKLAESQRLDPGGGTLLNLAICHEKEGKLATAWEECHEARSMALRDRRSEREKL